MSLQTIVKCYGCIQNAFKVSLRGYSSACSSITKNKFLKQASFRIVNQRFFGNKSKNFNPINSFIRGQSRKKFSFEAKKDEMKLIYVNSKISYYVLGTQLVVGAHSALLLYFVLQDFTVLRDRPLDAVFFDTPMQMGFSIIFTINLMVISCLCIRKIPQKMYYNEFTRKFKILKFTSIPFRKQTLECSDGSAVRLKRGDNVRSIFFGNTEINKERLIVSESCFAYPVYYNKFYGY